MIYTITLNPYLDNIIDIEELVYDDVNRIVEEKKHASGKGIDVSRVIKELGGQSIAMGLLGGYRGLELESRLINEGIVCDFIKISSETKTHITVYQRNKKIQTLLSASDPDVSSFEITTFFNKVKAIPNGNPCGPDLKCPRIHQRQFLCSAYNNPERKKYKSNF